MQWRPYTRVFTRLNRMRPTSRSRFTPAPQWHLSRRSFHFVDGKSITGKTPLKGHRIFHFKDGKLTTAKTPLKVQPQKDWNEEVDEADDAMAHQELSHIQQLLGLAESKNGKPVQDVVFVCIDCEAFEFDQSKITEIGMSRLCFRESDES